MYQSYKEGEGVPGIEEFPDVDIHADEQATASSR
jgi:hypothetical protein